MGNFKLTLPPIERVRRLKAQIQKNGRCQNITQEVTEYLPPLECGSGDQIILFFKVPAITASGSGVIVGSLLSRSLVAGNYEYWVSFADSLLVSGVSIDQCDILQSCCYDCQTEFLCRLLENPDPETIQDVIGAAMLPENGLAYDDPANLFEVAISDDEGNTLSRHNDGLFPIRKWLEKSMRRFAGMMMVF